MLVITVQEEEKEAEEGREKKKKETLHEFRSLVKLGSREVALCEDKQSCALCRPSLGRSQATARPETFLRWVLNLCLAAYYLLFAMQISRRAVRSESIWRTLTSCNESLRHLRFTLIYTYVYIYLHVFISSIYI